jgi:predicted SAM-dependent methyltransferase
MLSNIKKVIGNIDKIFDSDLLGMARVVENFWYRSNFLNSARRIATPLIVKIKCKIGISGTRPLRLHLGCGSQRINGYVNIDWRKTRATDIVCNILKIPYADATVDLIEAYHVIEHLPRHKLPKALKEWFRVMVPGAMLILECPDFDKAVKEYLEGNEKRIDNIFGLQRFPGDTHLFGYNAKRLKKILEEAGFKDVQNEDPTDYHMKDEPCLKVKCVKSNEL